MPPGWNFTESGYTENLTHFKFEHSEVLLGATNLLMSLDKGF